MDYPTFLALSKVAIVPVLPRLAISAVLVMLAFLVGKARNTDDQITTIILLFFLGITGLVLWLN